MGTQTNTKTPGQRMRLRMNVTRLPTSSAFVEHELR
jgi:hypothetical protein